MTGNTEVDTGELRTFARGMRQRADTVLGASEHLRSLEYGVGTFNLLVAVFAAGTQEAAARGAEGLMSLARNLGVDAAAVEDAAIAYDANEQDQVHRFGGGSRG